MGLEAGRKAIWKRIAYATRYGKAGVLESLQLDQQWLQDFIESVSDIVREENSASRK